MKFGYNFSWFQHKILHKPDPPTYSKKTQLPTALQTLSS